MTKQSVMANPFSTGGGGTRFEWLVATSYVVSLLRGEGARGLPASSTVVEVRLQQATKDYPVDDVVIVARRGTRESKLAIQVKHSLVFAPNPLFSKVMAECWYQYKAPTFDPDMDYVGIAIGEGCNILKIRTHLQEILQWARAHRTSRSFLMQVSKFKAKETLLNEISQALDAGVSPRIGKNQLWQLLRRFVVLPFDFDSTGSRDSTDCWDALRGIVHRRSPRQATAIFDGLYSLVSRFSQSGGEIDFDTIQHELQEHMPLGVMPPLRTTRASLVRQVTNQLLKEKKSRKYIPNVFTPIESIKDDARYFAHPVHFAAKLVDKFQAIDTSFLDRLHAMLRIPPLCLKLPKGFRTPSRLSQVSTQCSKLRAHFKSLASAHIDYYKEDWGKLSCQVPSETQYIFEDAKYIIRNPSCCIKHAIEDLVSSLSPMEARVFLIASRAGQGKTNFVCDFAENFLLLHQIPCILLTGRELRFIPTDELDRNLAKLMLENSDTVTLNDALTAIGSLCEEKNAPFVVIFDGINEHPDLVRFAVAIEKTIEHLLSFSFVKVIITCRSEYFSERFSNLRAATFSGSIHEVKDIHRQMPEPHRHRMMNAYFQFFKIKPSYMTSMVQQVLENDPLLLRFFSEAYGDPDANDSIMLPAMADVYRDVIFKKYLEKKLDEVTSKQSPRPGAGLSQTRQYKDVLRTIVAEMIASAQFSDIPLSAVDKSLLPALAELIAEDVFMRRDLVAGKSVLDSDAEVINFTFDEFRDYLLVDHLLNVVRSSAGGENAFRDKLDQFTANQCPVAEGVMRFVFYASKKPKCEELHASIATMPWYNTVFLQCIFSVEERCITEADIQRISDEFSRTPDKAKNICFALMRRWDTGALPRLNINILFRILDGMTDDAFDQLVLPIFYNPTYRYRDYSKAPYEIERFASDLRSTRRESTWDMQFIKLFEFLIYLFNVEGQACDFPAYALFREFAAQRPDEAVEMLSVHTKINMISVKTRIWEMLTEIAIQGFSMPATLVAQATVGIRNEGQGLPCVTDEMRRFLVASGDTRA